jgi:predicted RNase H-like HicB family nuclease
MQCKINLKKTDEVYAIWVPSLPGYWSQGKTEKEALENIKDAIQGYLETVKQLSEDKKSRYIEVR